MKAVSAAVMKEMDRRALARGIPVQTLMERAGSAVAQRALRELTERGTDRLMVFCGKGHNGGDGLVAARYLHVKGYHVHVCMMAAQNELSGPTLANYLSFAESGGSVSTLGDNGDMAAHRGSRSPLVFIDALFGTGFHGTLPAFASRVTAWINEQHMPVIAVDIPSGLDATTGRASPHTIRAHCTVTFQLPKTGFFRGDGPTHVGEIEVADIGFPEDLIREVAGE